jgi:hypothetical protein
VHCYVFSREIRTNITKTTYKMKKTINNVIVG